MRQPTVLICAYHVQSMNLNLKKKEIVFNFVLFCGEKNVDTKFGQKQKKPNVTFVVVFYKHCPMN